MRRQRLAMHILSVQVMSSCGCVGCQMGARALEIMHEVSQLIAILVPQPMKRITASLTGVDGLIGSKHPLLHNPSELA